MLLSDKINLALSISSFALAALSIVFVVLTIKQNSKMVENSTRPYVVIYGTYTNFDSPTYYLVVKNCGSTSARIEEFTASSNLADYSLQKGLKPFSTFPGSLLAPGQSVMCALYSLAIHRDMVPFEFDVTYSCGKKKYSEHFTINPASDIPNIKPRAATKGKELETISFTLQELVERLL